MIIAFCGASGSGKSSLIKEIIDLKNFRNKKLSLYNEDDFVAVKISKLILGNKNFREYNESKMSKEAKNKKNILFSSLVAIFYPLGIYLEYLYLYLYYKIIFSDRILLSDRFIYDYIVTLKQNLKIKNRFTEFMFINFPRPDLLFYLDIDPATAILRNKNAKRFSKTNSISYQAKIIREYMNVAKKKNMVTVNTKGEINDSLINIERHINNREILSMVKEIAVIGTDGSGKTTICNLLNDYSKSLNISSQVVHFFHENLLLKLLRKCGILREHKQDESMLGRSRMKSKRKIHRPYLLKFLLSMLHITDSYIQYIYCKLIHGNSLNIFDRYFYDYLIGFKYYGIKGFEGLEKFIPKVKNTFLMTVDANVAYKRKPEAFLDFYDFVNKAYLELAIGKRFIVVNESNKNPEEIMQIIISNLKV